MPIYAYKCGSCGHSKDVLQKMSDPPLTVCPACGASAFAKQLTAAGFQLKGSGWYATDFRGGSTGKPEEAKSGEGKTEAKPEPASGAKSETKTESKSESSATSKSSDAASSSKSSAAPAASSGPGGGGSAGR